MTFPIQVNMRGASGSQAVSLPSNYKDTFKFVSVSNISDNSMCIYPPGLTEPQAGMSIVCLGPYSAMTFPILPQMKEGFSVVWTNPGLTNLDKTKTAQLIFSVENLSMNSSFAPSFTTGGNVVNTQLVKVDPAVDLASTAKQDAILTKLDALLTALGGTLLTELTGSLPSLSAGSSLIGKVDLNTSNVEGTPDAAVPSKSIFVSGKYIVTDPAYTDGDLAPLRTNAKGELITLANREVKMTLTTIMNAVSVAVGAAVPSSAFQPLGANEMWVLVTIDKQPWDAYTSFGPWTGVYDADSANGNGLYPKRMASTAVYNSQSPARSLVTMTGTAIVSMSDAYIQRVVTGQDMYLYVKNSHATDVATVTAKLLRIWR